MSSKIAIAWKVLLLFQLTGHQPTQGRITEEVPPSPHDSGPLVHTSVGSIRGLRARDGNYSMFLGIPYAQVDPGDPFGPAIPLNFEDVFNAFDDSARCPQIEEFNLTTTGTLDCLHLNIYVPNSASVENPLPVMVVIFGGKFMFGFAGRYLYGPRFLVRHDIILVTFNYRLGPYGFMCLDTPEVPGNQGLKDQIKALRWIKDNIHSFGGDDSRITLGGNSAGGISVDLHAHFLQEELFDRIILQSGVAVVYSLIKKSDPEAPFKLAKELNYTAIDINDALSYISGVDPHQVVTATEKSGVNFGPCVEKQFDNKDNFITKYPVYIERVKDVDVLIGFNNDEGFVACSKLVKKKTDILRFSLNNTFEYRDENLFFEIENILAHFYYGDDARSLENRQPSTDVYSDFFMNYPTMRTVKKYLTSGVENMFLYMFSYSGERNFVKHKDNLTHSGGASHADELGYLFDISYMKEFVRSNDMLIVDRMTELWSNFVKYGNPTPQPSEVVPLRWPRVTREKWPYVEIDTRLRLRSRPLHARMALIDLLYKNIGQYERGLDNTLGGQI